MSNIITGYLAREIFKTSAATVLVLYIIFISNSLGRELADIADGDLPQQALWVVMLSQSVHILSMLLPAGVFFSIIFTFGRMYKDHEIVVMNACGLGYLDFYKPVAIVLLPMVLLSGYVSLVLNAQLRSDSYAAIDQGKDQNQFRLIKAGQFNRAGGDGVFYMESISEDRLELEEVILSQTGADAMIMEVAKSGQQKVDEVTGDLFLVLGPGQRVEGVAGQKDFKILDYEQHGILIQQREKSADTRVRKIAKPLATLWTSSRRGDWIELQWRIAIPIVLVTLAIVAVPLSHISPRQGRFGKVGYALMVYLVYFNLMVATRAQMDSGVSPILVNFWWVHLLFIALAAVLLRRRNKGVLFRKTRPS
jgi:lipopolysaccharide export system permease protein